MLAEPKIDSVASVDSGYEFFDEAGVKSQEEVALARKQISKNEQMHID